MTDRETSTGASVAAKPGKGAASGAAFVRQSSGLVRTGTPWRLFVFNITDQGIGAFTATFFLYGAGDFTHTDLWLAIIGASVAMVGFNTCYAMLGGAFPRSGGEYVYISRIITPALGFVVNFGAYMVYCFFAATGGYLIFTLALSPVLTAYGVVAHHPGFVSAGNWVGTNDHAWLLGSILVVAFAVMVAFGMKVYYRYQSIVWWSALACFIAFLIVFGTASRTDFIHGLDTYVRTTNGTHNAYSEILRAARRNGLSHGHSHELYDIVGILAIFIPIGSTAYIGGEVRTPMRSQLIGQVGGVAAFCGLVILLLALVSHTAGLPFNSAASFLNLQHPNAYPSSQTPVYTWYAFLCTQSPLLLAIMALAIILFSSFLVPQQIILPTRMLFAWAFDGLIPKRVADVEPRTHSPIVATVIVTITCLGMLALYGGNVITFINPIVETVIIWGVVAVTAVLFPFMPRTRRFFLASPANVRVLKVPIIALFGIESVIVFGAAGYIALTSDAVGANAASNLLVAAGIFAVPFLYYICVRWYRARQGIDLRANFAELPPD